MDASSSTQIGPYRVVGQLGAGGMGVVYAVVEPGLDRHLALKLLTQLGTRDPEERARLAREAQALARLNHPHVVRVHAAALEGPRPYLVQELLPGGSLQGRLATGPLPVDEVLSLARQLAAGLGHAHRHGVLHRDLKPANVMLDEQGQPKLVDFGLAAVSGASSLTRTGTVMGTPAYMAPEQALADRELDTRTDVYGLGALTYALLTGEPPFARVGGQAATLMAVASDPPPDPRALRPDTPAWLATLCVRCLAKDPAARPATAAALLAALEAGAAEDGSGSPARWGLAAGLFAVVALAAGLAWSQRAPAPRPATSPTRSGTPDPSPTQPVAAWDPAAAAAALARDDAQAALTALGPTRPRDADAARRWTELRAAASLLAGDTDGAPGAWRELGSASRLEAARLALHARVLAGPDGAGWPPRDIAAKLKHAETASPAWLSACYELLDHAGRVTWPAEVEQPLQQRLVDTLALIFQYCEPEVARAKRDDVEARLFARCQSLPTTPELQVAEALWARTLKRALPELEPDARWTPNQRLVWDSLRVCAKQLTAAERPDSLRRPILPVPWLATRVVEDAHAILSRIDLEHAVERVIRDDSPEAVAAAYVDARQAEFHGLQQWESSRQRGGQLEELDPDHSVKLVMARLTLGDSARARRQLEASRKLADGKDLRRLELMVAECDLLDGDFDAALDRIGYLRFERSDGRETHVDPYCARAVTHAARGDRQAALAELAKAPADLETVLPWRTVEATRRELDGRGWARLVAYARAQRAADDAR